MGTALCKPANVETNKGFLNLGKQQKTQECLLQYSRWQYWEASLQMPSVGTEVGDQPIPSSQTWRNTTENFVSLCGWFDSLRSGGLAEVKSCL